MTAMYIDWFPLYAFGVGQLWNSSLIDERWVFAVVDAVSIVFHIGVAPITQYTHVRNKTSNIQGSQPNVVEVIFHTIRNCS